MLVIAVIFVQPGRNLPVVPVILPVGITFLLVASLINRTAASVCVAASLLIRINTEPGGYLFPAIVIPPVSAATAPACTLLCLLPGEVFRGNHGPGVAACVSPSSIGTSLRFPTLTGSPAVATVKLPLSSNTTSCVSAVVIKLALLLLMLPRVVMHVLRCIPQRQGKPSPLLPVGPRPTVLLEPTRTLPLPTCTS